MPSGIYLTSLPPVSVKNVASVLSVSSVVNQQSIHLAHLIALFHKTAQEKKFALLSF